MRGEESAEREFTVSEPDKVWADNITNIATDEGWLFLAVVIDLFSRQVIGWSLRTDMTRDIVIDALRMAWFGVDLFSLQFVPVWIRALA